MTEWRIYYGDGSTYSDQDGPLEDAPALDVQAIACRPTDPKIKQETVIVHRFDYYWKDGIEWYGSDLFGLYDYLSRPGWKKVLFGRTMEHSSAYVEVIGRAKEDDLR